MLILRRLSYKLRFRGGFRSLQAERGIFIPLESGQMYEKKKDQNPSICFPIGP